MDHNEDLKDAGKSTRDPEMTGNEETGRMEHTSDFETFHDENVVSIKEEKSSDSSTDTADGKYQIKLQRASSESILLNKTYMSFLQYREEDVLLASDEESNSSKRSIKSTPGTTFRSSEPAKKYSKFRKYLNSVPGVTDCKEKSSSPFSSNETLEYSNNEENQEECGDILSKFEKSLVVDSETSNKHENALFMPKHGNFYCNTSQPSAWEIRNYLELDTYPMISSPISSKYINMENSQFLQSSSNSNIYDTSDLYLPDIISSQTSINRSVDASMISSPISSKCINMRNSQSPKRSSNSNSFYKTEIHLPDIISSQTSIYISPKMSLSPETELHNLPNYCFSPRKKDSLSQKLPSTSTHNVENKNEYHHSTALTSTGAGSRNKNKSPPDSSNMPQTTSRLNSLHNYCQKPNPVRRLNFDDIKPSNDDTKADFFKTPRNRKEILDSPDFGRALKMFSRSCEFPSTSNMNSSNANNSLSNLPHTDTTNSTKKSYNNSGFNSGNEITCSLAHDSPITIEKSSKSYSNPQHSKPKAVRKLKFEEMSPSNDASINSLKEKYTSYLSDLFNTSQTTSRLKSSDNLQNHQTKLKSVRRLDFDDAEPGSSLTGTHTTQIQFIESSEDNSTIPKIVGKISENAHCSVSSSDKSSENKSEYKETASTSNVLRSLEIINSENIEAHRVPQKRSFSTDETSDIDESDAEKQRHKKSKHNTSPEIKDYKNTEARHESRKRSLSNRQVSDEDSKKNKKFKQRSSNDKF